MSRNASVRNLAERPGASPEQQRPPSSGEGRRAWRFALTGLVGVALYVLLPRYAPLPDAASFSGSAAAKPAGASAKPARSSAAPAEAAKATAAAPTAAQPASDEARAKAEKKRREDWVKALRLFAIFVATIVGIIARPLPMGAVTLVGVTAVALTGTLPLSDALSGFSEKTLWLIIVAFMFARGFIKTGLGNRIAFGFMRLLGRKTLGLAYGLSATELVLSPLIPSNTGRAAGVIMPVMDSLSRAYGSSPEQGTSRRIGSFLTLSVFQCDVVISAMFLTAMAANPLAQKFAADLGVTITWSTWALAASVPGLLSLAIIPWLLFRLHRPEVTETPEAVEMARARLAALGPMSRAEWTLAVVFAVVLGLWMFGDALGVDATTVALVALGALLVAGVLGWSDVLAEKNAWDVLVWTGALIMMAGFLNKLGLIPWFSRAVGASAAGLRWELGFLALGLAYFYAHYFFASMTAHVSSMYAAFLAVAITLGAPPLLAALVLAFFSNLHASMTHYGTGPAAAIFGLGYVPIGTWWRLGLLVSVVNIAIWLVAGGLWWKLIGVW
jgi:DASS family divalent anion:Na+ symporter